MKVAVLGSMAVGPQKSRILDKAVPATVKPQPEESALADPSQERTHGSVGVNSKQKGVLEAQKQGARTLRWVAGVLKQQQASFS